MFLFSYFFLTLLVKTVLLTFKVNVTDILNGRQNGNQYYAAFAKLEDFTAVTKLWSYLKV